MKRFKAFIQKIIPLFRNFYFSTGIILLVWVSFFDANDLISQYRLSNKLGDLQKEKQYYTQKIGEVKFEREEVLGSPTLLEKFARDRYLMKKPTEDLYIVRIR